MFIITRKGQHRALTIEESNFYANDGHGAARRKFILVFTQGDGIINETVIE